MRFTLKPYLPKGLFQRSLRDRGIGVERVGIVGDGPLGDRLIEKRLI